MRKFLASLLSIASVTASAAGLQIIKVDEQHIQMGLAEGQVGEYYEIKPAIEIVLDASGYHFPPVPGQDSNEPNAIQLIIDNEHQFTAYWEPGVTNYTLNNSTLAPRFNDFSGFNAGDQFVIAIGVLVTDHEKEEQVFKVQWAGMGSVQP
ncbi:hypothetical protein [Halopseudomonas salina]|uniref:DUF2141 domain-containing protein n=1 Tax=Halopseudomonas salina TaxID=1323744 RepID=A0ABQ1Q1Q1_9GAMM|nr:hypothetical protein [Halopseudomonas salina]GGD09484.1 hypothetical protein GCM10007418_30680 [Halopseudomonas salina]